MDITGSVSLAARFRETIPAGPGNARPMRRYHRVGIHPYRFTYGTGPGQGNLVWTSAETVAFDSSDFSYIVPSLYLRSIFRGSSGAAFDVVRFIMIANTETTPGRDLVVGGFSDPFHWSAPWTASGNGSVIPPGSSWIAHNHLEGWAIGQASVLRISPVAGDVAVEIIIVGVGSIAE